MGSHARPRGGPERPPATARGRHRAAPEPVRVEPVRVEPVQAGRHRAAPARGPRQIPIPAVAGAAALVVAAACGVAVASGGSGGSGSAGATFVAAAGPPPPPIAAAPAPERAARDEVRAPLSPRQAAREAARTRARAQALLDARLAAAAAARLAALQRACGYDPAAQRAAPLSAAQQDNARTIVLLAQRLGLPPRAAVIAIATVLQESYLMNLAGGHLDSAGLFQQRPSAGWGSYTQVTDPAYAARTFYRELTEVPGWRRLPLTVAAQDVQVSAFPSAYARWEGAAAGIVSGILRVPVDSLNCAPRPAS